MKGKWAEGICPRNFRWIMKGRLAICERPGGRGESHRRVRRTEEILWIREQGFTRIVSLIPSTHNLHSYTEQNVAWSHWPLADNEDYPTRLGPLYTEMHGLLSQGEKLLVHRRRVGDEVCGFMAGYLLWSGMVATESQAVVVTEKMTERPFGALGRHMVNISAGLPKPKARLRLVEDPERADNGPSGDD